MLSVRPCLPLIRWPMTQQNNFMPLLRMQAITSIITEDGEQVFVRAQSILAELDSLVDEVSERRREPSGHIRMCSSFGFGRNMVASAIAQLTAAYPGLQVRLEVFDRLVDPVAEGFDLDVRVGDEIAPYLIARKLLANHRILCAAPGYLERFGTPLYLQDLGSHQCLAIKERDHPFGVWRLRGRNGEETVKVSGALSTNHGGNRVALGNGGGRHCATFAMGCSALYRRWQSGAGLARVHPGSKRLGCLSTTVGRFWKAQDLRRIP